MRSLFTLALLAALAAAAPPTDPLLAQLLRDAKATKPVAFERTQRVEENGKPMVYVDRYDPVLTEPWKLVSIDGRTPKPDEFGDWKKTIRNGIPGYARVAALLGAAHRVDATHYHVAPLPKGFITPGFMAEHLTADLTVDAAAARPYVSVVSFRAPGPFRLFVLSKVDRFEASNHYAPGPDGAPRIVSQDTLIAGSGPGISGTQIKKATFRPLAR